MITQAIKVRLVDRLTLNDLYDVHQSAYRSDHSTETALLHLMERLLAAADAGNVTVLTLLDVSAAFDTIDHVQIIECLKTEFDIHSRMVCLLPQ